MPMSDLAMEESEIHCKDKRPLCTTCVTSEISVISHVMTMDKYVALACVLHECSSCNNIRHHVQSSELIKTLHFRFNSNIILISTGREAFSNAATTA